MFSWDRFTEIYHSLKQHKVRNILTGFGVAWGIFILILLLGAGQGLQDGIMKLFSSYAQNSIWVYAGQTSETQKGGKSGEQIVFNQELLTNLNHRFSQVKFLSPEISYNGNAIVSYQKKHQIGQVKGVGLNYFDIKILNLGKGRLFNPLDYKEQRPVCIVGSNLVKVLAKNKQLIGEYINIADNWFKVIGVLEKGTALNQGEQNAVYIPFSAFQNSFGNNNAFFLFGMLLNDHTDSEGFETKLKDFLAHQLHFEKSDNKAVFISNTNQQVKSFNKLFAGIEAFLWFVGFSMLLSGIIGVGNIMLVIVKERTKEIGIRKALGGRSKSILFMVVSEAITITLLSGLVGLFLGLIIIELANYLILKLYDAEEVLINSFTVNVPVIIGAVILLVISGALAGIIPAKKAADVMPVNALNQE
jgi:putative ABC transport system permease protein